MAATKYFAGEDQTAIPKNRNAGVSEKLVHLPFTETRIILSVLGAVPCLAKNPYWPSIDVKQSTFLYCVCVYSVISLDVAWSIFSKKQQIDEIGSSNEVLRQTKLLQLMMLIPSILTVFIWLDTSSLQSTLKSFVDLQDKYLKATGKDMKLRRKTLERYITTYTILAPAVFWIVTHLFIPIMRVESYAGLAIMYGNAVVFLFTFHWIGLSMTISDAAADVLTDFRQRVMGGDITSRKVFDFRLVWLSLRATMDSMSELQTPSAINSISLCIIVIMFYGSLHMLAIGETSAGVSNLLAGGYHLIIVSLSCLSSHHAQEKAKNMINDALSYVSLSSYGNETQREIIMLYLVEGARPAVVSLRGFTVANKNLILSFISNIATYIIVLMQFVQKTD